ncbi:MAG: hypothetical protein LBB36_05900 [Fibromonadaceae bacterium]|jgi:hypothetical protein|nr:hypothetical protein [Fibromonadaceae bacterium]
MDIEKVFVVTPIGDDETDIREHTDNMFVYIFDPIKNLPEILIKVKEKFNDGLKHFNDRKGIIS